MRARLRDLWLPFGAVLLVACESGSADLATSATCGEGLSVESLEGEWHITAQGERYACGAARSAGDIDITVVPFRVDVELEPTPTPSAIDSGDEADAFVDRVLRAQVLLTANISDDVEFKGSGNSDCQVNFSIDETLSNGNVLAYDFDGTVIDFDRATGTFTGTGPGECKVRGTFDLERR